MFTVVYLIMLELNSIIIEYIQASWFFISKTGVTLHLILSGGVILSYKTGGQAVI